MTDLTNVTPVNTPNTPAGDPPSTEGTPQAPAPAGETKPPVNPPADDPASNPPPEGGPAGDPEGEKPGETPEPENEPEELDTEVWGDYGDEVANSVLHTLQTSGVTTDEAKALLWDAVEAGDPSKVDRDTLVEKVGKEKATLIMAGIENVTARNNEKIAEVKGIATAAAGGADNWSKATEWAKANMSESDLEDLRGMLDKGGRQATFAAREIVDSYNKDPKNTALDAGSTHLTPDAPAKPKVQGISRLEYGQALDRLYRKGASPADYAALKAKRDAGIKQGL